MPRNLTSTFHQPEKETAARKAPPCWASAAATPVLRLTRPPQRRERLYLQVSWTYSQHPPCLHLTCVCSPSSSRLVFGLDTCCFQLWPGIHSKVTLITHQYINFCCLWCSAPPVSVGPGAQCFRKIISPSPLLSWLLWSLGWHFLFLLPPSFFLSPTFFLFVFLQLWGTVFEDYFGVNVLFTCIRYEQEKDVLKLT